MRNISIKLDSILDEKKKTIVERIFYNDVNTVKINVSCDDVLDSLHVVINSRKMYLDFHLEEKVNNVYSFTFPSVAIKTDEKILLLFEGFSGETITNYGTFEMGVNKYDR